MEINKRIVEAIEETVGVDAKVRYTQNEENPHQTTAVVITILNKLTSEELQQQREALTQKITQCTKDPLVVRIKDSQRFEIMDLKEYQARLTDFRDRAMRWVQQTTARQTGARQVAAREAALRIIRAYTSQAASLDLSDLKLTSPPQDLLDEISHVTEIQLYITPPKERPPQRPPRSISSPAPGSSLPPSRNPSSDSEYSHLVRERLLPAANPVSRAHSDPTGEYARLIRGDNSKDYSSSLTSPPPVRNEQEQEQPPHYSVLGRPLPPPPQAAKTAAEIQFAENLVKWAAGEGGRAMDVVHVILAYYKSSLGGSLNLSGYGLSSLPPELFTLPTLTRLDLSNNRLSALPPEIEHLINLQDLQLNGNPLTTLPNELGRLRKLQVINLSENNQLSFFPEVLLQLPALSKLNLAQTNLSELPAAINQLKKLEELNIRDTPLTKVTKEVKHLPNLKRLLVSPHQQLTKGTKKTLGKKILTENRSPPSEPPVLTPEPVIYETVAGDTETVEGDTERVDSDNTTYAKLQRSTSRNDTPTEAKTQAYSRLVLTSIQFERGLADWAKREGDRASQVVTRILAYYKSKQDGYLNLSGYGLTSLPPELFTLQTLTRLDLSKNSLSALPPEIGRLINLKDLQLNGNPLTTLPDELQNLRKLQVINLSENNQLSFFPAVLLKLSDLIQLNLAQTKLSELPTAINQLKKLEELNIRKTPLTEVPNEVKNLPKLNRLWVSPHQRLTEGTKKKLRKKILRG